MTNEEVLVTFLKHHGCYHAFRLSLSNRDPIIPRESALIKFALVYAFHWPATIQGYNHWSALNSKWELLISHFNLKGFIIYSELNSYD